MSLRDWNRTRIAWYLNGDWADRLPGSSDPEQLFESRKLESRVILRATAKDSVDAYYKAKLERDEEAMRYAATERMMDELISVYMPQEHPALARHFREWFLKDGVAGPVIEIERFEKMYKRGAPLAGLIAERGRWYIERMLDHLDEQNFRLFVHKDHRASSLTEARHQGRYDEKEITAAGIRKKWDYYKEETKWSDADIRRRLMQDFGKGRDTVNKALRERPGDDWEQARERPEDDGEGVA